MIEFRIVTKAENVEKIAKEIAKIKEVKAIYLFGSFVTGKMHANSDIDMCVFLEKENEEISYEVRGYGSDNLEISIFHELPVAIRFRIFREGTPLIIKDEDFVYKVKKATLWEYHDFKPHLDRMIMEKLKCTT